MMNMRNAREMKVHLHQFVYGLWKGRIFQLSSKKNLWIFERIMIMISIELLPRRHYYLCFLHVYTYDTKILELCYQMNIQYHNATICNLIMHFFKCYSISFRMLFPKLFLWFFTRYILMHNKSRKRGRRYLDY